MIPKYTLLLYKNSLYAYTRERQQKAHCREREAGQTEVVLIEKKSMEMIFVY